MSEEISHTPHFDPDEARRQALENGSGWSPHAARVRVDDEKPFFQDDRPKRAPRKWRARRTGHVRDFESDRDHIDEMAALPAGFEVEQSGESDDPQLTLDFGHAAAAEVAYQSGLERIKRDTGDDPVRLKARIKAYKERYHR